MSQRLLLRRADQDAADDAGYDLVLTDADDPALSLDRLRREYFADDGEGHLGPWKISIHDQATYRLHEPAIREAFAYYGAEYPACVWVFYAPPDRELVHPSDEALRAWLQTTTQ